MDYQSQMLAHAEYKLSNQLARRAARTELLDPRERRFRLPQFPIPAVRNEVFRLRAAVDALASRTSRKAVPTPRI
jgi:hypothetical protein